MQLPYRQKATICKVNEGLCGLCPSLLLLLVLSLVLWYVIVCLAPSALLHFVDACSKNK